MTSTEKKIKAAIELTVINNRIDELKRAKAYMPLNGYFTKRLLALENKADALQESITDEPVRRPKDEVKLVFSLPEDVFEGFTKARKNNGDIFQILKREYLINE